MRYDRCIAMILIPDKFSVLDEDDVPRELDLSQSDRSIAT